MPLTKVQLDEMGCSHPECKDPKCDKLYLHSSCHPDEPTWAYYKKGTGVLTIACSKCKKEVVQVAVMGCEDPIELTPRDENAPIKSPFLLNAAEQAKQNPKTFKRPSEERIKGVVADDYVKVCVPRDGKDGTTGERFWALVRVIMTEGKMWAQVANDLDPACGLKYTDVFWMHEDNIYDIQKGEKK